MGQNNHYMENIVRQVLEKVLDGRGDVCKCEKCKTAMAKRILDHLSPSDMNSQDQETTYIRVQTVDLQLQADAAKHATEAIDYVKAHPAH